MRAVVDAARAGTPLDRMAILHASPEPYARLAHEQLSAAGIAAQRRGGHAPHRPGGGPYPARAAAPCPTVASAATTSSPGWPGPGCTYEGRPIPVTAWERLSRDAGVVAGRDRLGPSAWPRFADDREAECRLGRSGSRCTPVAGRTSPQPRPPGPGRCGSSCSGLIDDLAEAAARPQSVGRAGRLGPAPPDDRSSATSAAGVPLARGRAEGGRTGRAGP